MFDDSRLGAAEYESWLKTLPIVFIAIIALFALIMILSQPISEESYKYPIKEITSSNEDMEIIYKDNEAIKKISLEDVNDIRSANESSLEMVVYINTLGDIIQTEYNVYLTPEYMKIIPNETKGMIPGAPPTAFMLPPRL